MTKLERLLLGTVVLATLFNTMQIFELHKLMVSIAESLDRYSTALYAVWRAWLA